MTATNLLPLAPLLIALIMIVTGKKCGVAARKRVCLSLLAGLVVTPLVLLVGLLATLAFVSATSIRVSVPFLVETVLTDGDGNGPHVEGGAGIGVLAALLVVGVSTALYRYDPRKARGVGKS